MSPARMQRLESAIRAVLAFNEAFNRQDVAAMMQLMSDDCIFESSAPPPIGIVYPGKEIVAKYWRAFFSQSSTARNQIEDIFSSGEHCVMRKKFSWTDSQGTEESIRGVDIFRVYEGSICEHMAYVKGS